MVTESLCELSWKPDLGRTLQRFDAWWDGQIIDRPPVTLAVKPDQPYKGPISHHAGAESHWLDVEYVVDRAIAEMSRYVYVGDSLPLFNPNVGPEVTATLLGCELRFSETTSWSTPIVHDPRAWDDIAARPPVFDNRYWRTIEQLTAVAIQKSAGRYLVGMTDLHNSYDMLAALRDPQALCMDLLDCPDRVDLAARHAAAVFVEAVERNHRLLSDAGMGGSCWVPFYHRGCAYVASCDFWCMVSGAYARDRILPRIVEEMAPMQRSIFHLDGPQALRHLDLLLELADLDAVQWVYGAGNGPAWKWIEVYRRILAAGKSVQVLAADAQDALAVHRSLGGRGVWLTIEKPLDSLEQADAFLKQLT